MVRLIEILGGMAWKRADCRYGRTMLATLLGGRFMNQIMIHGTFSCFYFQWFHHPHSPSLRQLLSTVYYSLKTVVGIYRKTV